MHAIKQHPLTCIFVSTCSMHTDRPLVGYTCKKRTVHCKLSTGVNNIVLHPVNNVVLHVVLHPVNNIVLPTVNNVMLPTVNNACCAAPSEHKCCQQGCSAMIT